MFTDGAIHDLNYFDVPLSFKPVEVTAASYEEEKDALYFLNSFEIPDGAQSIKFTYYNDREQIIDADTVPVLKDGQQGEQGEQGTHGPSYQGLYEAGNYDAVTNSFSGFYPADAVENDYFLNSSDGYIWVLKDARWNPSTDYAADSSRYMQAVNDALGAGLDGATQIMSAVNMWVNNLVANTAFINNLFAQHITATKLDIVDGSFTGSIDAGPLLLNFNPATEREFLFINGSSVDSILNSELILNRNRNVTTDNQSYYGSETVTSIKSEIGDLKELYLTRQYSVYMGRVDFKNYYNNYTQKIYKNTEYYRVLINNEVLIAKKEVITYTEEITSTSTFENPLYPIGTKTPLPENPPVEYVNLDKELYIHLGSDTWTFKLRNLPDSSAAEYLGEGTVYRNGNNLCII